MILSLDLARAQHVLVVRLDRHGRERRCLDETLNEELLELLVLDRPGAINVEGGEDGAHRLVRRLQPELLQRLDELGARDMPRAIVVHLLEQVDDASVTLVEGGADLVGHWLGALTYSDFESAEDVGL